MTFAGQFRKLQFFLFELRRYARIESIPTMAIALVLWPKYVSILNVIKISRKFRSWKDGQADKGTDKFTWVVVGAPNIRKFCVPTDCRKQFYSSVEMLIISLYLILLQILYNFAIIYVCKVWLLIVSCHCLRVNK